MCFKTVPAQQPGVRQPRRGVPAPGLPLRWVRWQPVDGSGVQMIITIEVQADSADHARQAAVGQARAQGYSRVEAVFTTPLGGRRYRVQMTVTR